MLFAVSAMSPQRTRVSARSALRCSVSKRQRILGEAARVEETVRNKGPQGVASFDERDGKLSGVRRSDMIE